MGRNLHKSVLWYRPELCARWNRLIYVHHQRHTFPPFGSWPWIAAKFACSSKMKKKKIFCFLLKEKKKIRRLPEDEAWQRSGWPQPKRTRSSFVIGRCFIFVNEWMIRNSFESHSFWLLKETNFLFIFFLFFVQDFRGLCKWWEAWIVTFFLFLFFPPSRRKRWAEWMKSAAAVSSAPPKMVNLPAGRPVCFAFENHF